MSNIKQIRWLIIGKERWYLGPNRGTDDPVCRWYADTPLAYSFLSQRDAIEKLAERRLTCHVGIEKQGRIMTCDCVGATVQAVLWPKAEPVTT